MKHRNSSRYRTPYGPYGGFTNGYEGNLPAFLLRAQHALSGSKEPFRAIPPSLLQPLQPRISPSPRGPPSPYVSAYAPQRHPTPSDPESFSPRPRASFDNTRGPHMSMTPPPPQYQ